MPKIIFFIFVSYILSNRNRIKIILHTVVIPEKLIITININVNLTFISSEDKLKYVPFIKLEKKRKYK